MLALGLRKGSPVGRHAHLWAVAGDSEGLYCHWFVPCQLGTSLWRDLLTWLSSFEVEKITQPRYLFRQLLMNVIKIYPKQI